MAAGFGPLGKHLKKIMAISRDLLPAPSELVLPEQDGARLTGKYGTSDGRYFRVVAEGNAFRISGLSNGEFLAIDAATLYARNDPELLVRFSEFHEDVYNRLVMTHPIRLAITAIRI